VAAVFVDFPEIKCANSCLRSNFSYEELFFLGHSPPLPHGSRRLWTMVPCRFYPCAKKRSYFFAVSYYHQQLLIAAKKLLNSCITLSSVSLSAFACLVTSTWLFDPEAQFSCPIMVQIHQYITQCRCRWNTTKILRSDLIFNHRIRDRGIQNAGILLLVIIQSKQKLHECARIFYIIDSGP